MFTEADEAVVSPARAEGGISRRRIIQGAAWATPAILIATAAPAAASSPPVKGGLAITSASATTNTTNFFVTCTIVYLGDGAPDADYPVSDVTMSVTLPTDRVMAGTPGVTALTWSYVGSAVVGTNTIYTFRWNGGELSAANPSAGQVTVRIPATPLFAPVDALINAQGSSYESTVFAAQVSVPVGIGADLVFNGGAAVTYRNSFPSHPNNAYYFSGVGRWNGPWTPLGSPITGLEFVARIPEAYTDGTVIEDFVGAGWSRLSGPTLKSGVWQVAYIYAHQISDVNQATTDIKFAFRQTGTPTANIATAALYGLANGSPNYVSEMGPASVP